jgi:hypothetical protein
MRGIDFCLCFIFHFFIYTVVERIGLPPPMRFMGKKGVRVIFVSICFLWNGGLLFFVWQMPSLAGYHTFLVLFSFLVKNDRKMTILELLGGEVFYSKSTFRLFFTKNEKSTIKWIFVKKYLYFKVNFQKIDKRDKKYSCKKV